MSTHRPTEARLPIPRMERKLEFSAEERARVLTLVVEADENDGRDLRAAMQLLGYVPPQVVSDHSQALKVLQERPFTHVFFTATRTNLSAVEFMRSARAMDANLVAIPTSFDPRIDDIFTLLQEGARWFLVKPFTEEIVDDCLIQATKGEPFSQSLLFAEDRNKAFSALIAANIDRAADTYRDARKYTSARAAQESVMKSLRATAQLARVFAEDATGDRKDLRGTLLDFFSDLARGPATRLGRIRRRLRVQRDESAGRHSD